MEFIFVCPKCGATFGSKDQNGIQCPDCRMNTVFTGFYDTEWYALPRTEREERKKDIMANGNPGLRRERMPEEEKQQNGIASAQESSNTLGDVLTILAIVNIIAWIYLGIKYGKDYSGDFVFSEALEYWVIGVLSGLFLLWCAEIVKLLHSINQKLGRQSSRR